ncbi:hypothetical protein R8Z50_18835 [Longispora sp. K20-0274]|uniref:hypothetical protein n=1 Tax=Longispora sp. K20-0274 TaxID=3088255 RepID=UPI00399A03FB
MTRWFYTHLHRALRDSANDSVENGRLQGEAPLVVADLANPAVTLGATAKYELFGPGDVERLGGGAITRRYPHPGAGDAENTKLAHVEFSAPDLPWRYSPDTDKDTPRPFLVLVVGPPGPDGIVERPDGRVTLSTPTQTAHALDQARFWAHLHDVDGARIARITSPLPLEPDKGYLACLVPAYTADGQPAWHGGAPVTVDCYDRWTFRTGPEGDFRSYARKLHRANLAQVEAKSGLPFGRADVAYAPRGGGAPFPLPTGGALRLPTAPADPATPAVAAAETEALSDPITTPDGRGVVTAPRYDAPFTDPAAPPPATGWAAQLRQDPRRRGAAGLGAWTAIAWQDRIGDAAATLAGDLRIAHDRIRHVALGVEVSRSLWRRRMPLPAAPGADPATVRAAAARRLAVLAPALARLPADTGGTVLDAIAGRTPGLTAALLSSAARRAYRPGPARIALAQPGAGRFDTVLAASNACPPAREDPADIRRGDVDPGRVEEAVKDAVYTATGGDDRLTGEILDALGGVPDAGFLAAVLAALAPGPDGRTDPDAVRRVLDQRPHGDVIDPASWGDWLAGEVPDEPCRPVDLAGLADAVAAGIDPHAEPAPAARRVLSTLPGFTHLGPVEIDPEIDLPLWKFLSENSPDWMLPGVGDLDQHSVVGVATNPEFVQALMVGANHQAAAELRWRNIALVTRCSPLRRFWQRGNGTHDITPIRTWPAASPLGGPGTDEGQGAEAVVVFRTPIFRRYPNTVVYLYNGAQDGWKAPAGSLDPLRRKDPAFTGTIGPEVTFFGFRLDPAKLTDYWVVLEEPPAGYRFEWKDSGATDSAHWAYDRFALPVRVLIGPLL